jgi:transcriptional regulator with XRE-family HTH domain
MPFERVFPRAEILRLAREANGATQQERDQAVADAVGCKPRLIRTVRRMADLTARRGNPWPEEMWQRCRDLQDRGEGVTAIAKAIGKTSQAVYRKLERKGRADYKARRTRCRIRRQQAEQLLRMKMPREAVAERTGYTVKTIRRFERELERIKPKRKTPNKEPNAYPLST